MGLDELREKLSEKRELLEEVAEERMIILGQGNIHLPGNLVKKYERELNGIKEEIALLEKLIQEKA
ncbi:hypothetical protein IZU99_00945 [Oscillospiraceae bacterium CM]|nr:hypothetical protein IZU99_00945 [Oscillospiraceae bacterium CM]